MTRLRNTKYEVTLRRVATGEQHKRMLFASDAETATARAIAKARIAMGSTMVEKLYEPYEVVSCEVLAT